MALDNFTFTTYVLCNIHQIIEKMEVIAREYKENTQL